MPSTKTSPDNGKSDALHRFASVDLPEPLWPSTAVLEPGFKLNENVIQGWVVSLAEKGSQLLPWSL